jgi:hypothetical protein
MRNVLFIFDDYDMDRKSIVDKSCEWAAKNQKQLELISINADNKEKTLDQVVNEKLRELHLDEGDKLTVISGGSTSLSNFKKTELFNRGFVDVLEGLKSFLVNMPNLNPFIAIRSGWFKNSSSPQNIKSISQKSLNDLLESLPEITRDKNNNEEIQVAASFTQALSPDEIYAISSPINDPFFPDDLAQTNAFFAFLDKAFKG